MKTRILALLFLAVSLCGAASAPTWVASLVTVQADPRTGIAEAFFARTMQVEGVGTVAHPQGWQRVSWSLGSTATTTIGDITLTDAQVFQFVAAIAERRRAEADAPPPAPEEP